MLSVPLSLRCRRLAEGVVGSGEPRDGRRKGAVPGRPSRDRCGSSASGSTRASPARQWSALLQAALVALAAVSVFWNSVDGEFVHDDVVAIVKNEDVRTSSPFFETLTHDFWGESLRSERSHKSYRPLCVATFRPVSSLPHSKHMPSYLLICFLLIYFFISFFVLSVFPDM